MRKGAAGALLLCGALLLGSCGAIYASRHRIAPGDTLYSIAKTHGTTVEELRALNGLDPDDVLRPGDSLFLPAPAPAPRPAPGRVSGPAPAQPSPPRDFTPREPSGNLAPPPRQTAAVPPERLGPEKTSISRSRPPVPKQEPPARQALFRRPVPGEVIRPFASEGRGIDLKTAPGEAVRAAAAGKVSYSGTPARAYGAMVILDHEGDWYTVYSNLDGLGVRSGQLVAANEILGQASGFLHFEVRRGSAPQDPLLFLPPR